MKTYDIIYVELVFENGGSIKFGKELFSIDLGEIKREIHSANSGTLLSINETASRLRLKFDKILLDEEVKFGVGNSEFEDGTLKDHLEARHIAQVWLGINNQKQMGFFVPWKTDDDMLGAPNLLESYTVEGKKVIVTIGETE